MNYICEHANQAHWIMFCLLLLTGLNLPISEEIMLIGGGAIASTCIPDHALRLYIWIFLGCYLSAWEAYWIGRLLGPRLYRIRLFKFIITPHRLDWLRHYYAKFGIFTFIVGRFCPGGIRNALFMSSGLTKMPFHLFILRDGLACLLSSLVFFHLGYHFGENIDPILVYFQRYSDWFLIGILTLILAGFAYLWYIHRP
ncbi:DedA family protein [Candidatus Protochlamydia phocaeensis]|uniref:DedA family protein n=1 Tax=Candidatus Protochlamydia phocaeensis TaxID=1414722 RepID=UPI001E2B3BC6|nr:DedA family protein [Candidatus Protochlamydia phocaeensis]